MGPSRLGRGDQLYPTRGAPLKPASPTAGRAQSSVRVTYTPPTTDDTVLYKKAAMVLSAVSRITFMTEIKIEADMTLLSSKILVMSIGWPPSNSLATHSSTRANSPNEFSAFHSTNVATTS